jgi:signal transduction histidine kinase
MRRTRGLRLSLAVLAGLLVLLVAGLAGGGLWILRGIQSQSAYEAAARAVLRQGELITAYLATQPAMREQADSARWSDFGRLFESLRTLEPNMEYVSVSSEGTTLFHRQAENIVQAPGPTPGLPGVSTRDIRLSRRVMEVGSERVPVVVFASDVREPGAPARRLEVALRRDAVEYEEEPAALAIARMFRVALLTIAASFAVCAMAVFWMMMREANREAMRRREEHLAFSGVMANGIAHDFRNPMSSARLDAQMLEREVSRGSEARPERAAALAVRIRATLDRMDQVLKEFLYLSRPAGQPSEIEVGAMLDGCLEMMAGRFERAGVCVERSFPSEPAHIATYEGPLRRAVVNIINNAIQALPEGGKVRVGLGRSPHGIQIEVADSGPGVPKEMRERIFDMFFTTRPEGTGLGLFLAKAAVENCGGTIRIVDGPLGGACFRIDIPDRRQEPGAGEKKA